MALTKLLLHMDGADASTTFIDSSSNAYTVTTAGNVQIDTAQSVFGGASGLFDGTGDYLSLADSADWAFGAGDFTIDFRAYISDISAKRTFYSQYVSGTQLQKCEVGANGRIWFASYNSGNVGVGVYYTATLVLTTGQWYHLAFVRSGTNGYVFKDGVSLSLTTDSAFSSTPLDDLAAPVLVGSYATPDGDFNGWIDEFRISKGIARWTANFTPPTSAYTPGDAYTQTLADSVSTVDSEKDINGWIRRFFESITLADFLTTRLAKGYVKTLGDLVALAEYLSLQIDYQKKFAESISLADYLTKVIGHKRVLPDGITLAEKLFTVKGQPRTLAETLTLTEHFIREVGYKRNFPDTISLADAIRKGIGKIFPETITSLDVFKRLTVMSQRIPEALNLRDNDFTVEATDKDIIEISKNPQIASGARQGQLLSIEWVSDDPKFRLVDGRGVSMAGGKEFIMSSGSIINLVYDTANSVWQEASRSETTWKQ